jgi:hypothetical protein
MAGLLFGLRDNGAVLLACLLHSFREFADVVRMAGGFKMTFIKIPAPIPFPYAVNFRFNLVSVIYEEQGFIRGVYKADYWFIHVGMLL